MADLRIERGERVRIDGERGKVYFIVSEIPTTDGSILVYGGSKNPNAHRGYRNVMPEKLRPAPIKG